MKTPEIAAVRPCCSICKHFELNLGSHGYSKLTPGERGPGSEASIYCDKQYEPKCPWHGETGNESAITHGQLVAVACKCPFYEVADELQPIPLK